MAYAVRNGKLAKKPKQKYVPYLSQAESNRLFAKVEEMFGPPDYTNDLVGDSGYTDEQVTEAANALEAAGAPIKS